MSAAGGTQTVLITGATDGLGKAAALLLAERGYRVFAAGRSADKRAQLDALAKEKHLLLETMQMDVCVVANVHLHGFEEQMLFFGQSIKLRALVRRTPGREHAIASLGEQERRGLSQSIGSPGNQYCLSSARCAHSAPSWRWLSYRELERA